MAQCLVEQYPGNVIRSSQLGRHQVDRALVIEALGGSSCTAAALALIFLAHALGDGRVVHVEGDDDLRRVFPM